MAVSKSSVFGKLVSLSGWEVVILGTAAITLYFLVVSIYRLTLHPLAKYPGPFWKKISDWPLVFACHRGDRHIEELLEHEKYGPIVRYGPNSLSFATASALATIHSPRANVRKGDWYKTLDISAGAPSVQMVLDKNEHLIRRRFISPAFSERALKDAEPLINMSALKLADRIKSETGLATDDKGWSMPLDFSDWATFYGFDFISDLSFGMSFNMIEDRETRYIPTVLKNASQFLYYVGYLPFIDLVRPFMGSSVQDYVGGQSAKDSLRYTELANTRLADRINAETKRKKLASHADDGIRKDVFHYLINASGKSDTAPGRTFTTEEMQADSALLIAAGSDGVGLTVAATMFYLLDNPSTYTALTSEIRAAFSSPADIKTPTLSTLPYLHAALEETLRLNPPKASALPRVVLPGGLVIDDHFIPAGTTVGVPAYTLHHDPAHFTDPWTFIPERWIPGTGATNDSIAAQRAAFFPFLVGPMNCIGKNMAYLAAKLALAHLLLRYDFRPIAESCSSPPTASAETKASVGEEKESRPRLKGAGRRGDEHLGRRREREYQMIDWILGFRDGPCVQIRDRFEDASGAVPVAAS